jgi:hypothetical protein
LNEIRLGKYYIETGTKYNYKIGRSQVKQPMDGRVIHLRMHERRRAFNGERRRIRAGIRWDEGERYEDEPGE